MAKQTKRSEVREENMWDLQAFYKNSDEFEKDYQEVISKLEEIPQYQGHIMDSAQSLLAFEIFYTSLDRKVDNLFTYVSLKQDEDTTNPESQKQKMRITKLLEKVNSAFSFVIPEVLEKDYDVVLEFIKEEPKLENYRFDLDLVYRMKEHTLSQEEERIITLAGNAMGAASEAFDCLDNTDIKMKSIIDSNGEEVELTNANYGQFLSCKDREIRANAFHTLYDYYKGIKHTLAACLSGTVREVSFYANVKKFDSALQMSLFDDNIDVKVYENLISTVSKHLDLIYDYMEVRKQLLGYDELHLYDLSVDLVSVPNRKFTFDQAKEIILEALKPLGEEYISILKKAFKERWMDIYPNVGKKSGAYSTGSYDSYPYLLLNYDETDDSVSTTAHELGHSVHTYLSNQTQDYLYHNYPIFLAEIASTVNEVILNEYFYQNAKTKEEKILYLSSFLDKVRTTIYRQTMFAEFEKVIFEKEQAGIPLTEKEFSTLWYELNQKYYGEGVTIDDDIRYEWSRIPHFYTPFYTYKYATGLSAAIQFASKILAGDEKARDAYLDFLRSGGSDYPLEILKRAGVDMTTPEPIEKAIAFAEEKLKELKNLL